MWLVGEILAATGREYTAMCSTNDLLCHPHGVPASTRVHSRAKTSRVRRENVHRPRTRQLDGPDAVEAGQGAGDGECGRGPLNTLCSARRTVG